MCSQYIFSIDHAMRVQDLELQCIFVTCALLDASLQEIDQITPLVDLSQGMF
jgi:hypothetical protein